MPTNLPPDYYHLEEEYRQASSPEEKIAYLEKMMSVVPKHKGTDHLRADLRRRLSELRSPKRAQKGPSRQESVYHIDREGAGQVAVIGPANTGKSTLVKSLTNATPDVAPYPFTTWTPTPGMMPIDNIQVQLIDTPPINGDHIEPEMMAMIRRADLALLMLDLQAFPIEQLEESVALLQEHHIVPRHLREHVEVEGYVAYLPFLILVNKTDDETLDEDFQVLCELVDEGWMLLPLSMTEARYIDEMKQAVFEALDVIRVYAKPAGQEVDHSAPFVMRRGGTVEEFAGKVHRDFLESFQYARIWGHGVYDGQMVGREHVLHDEDVVELHA